MLNYTTYTIINISVMILKLPLVEIQNKGHIGYEPHKQNYSDASYGEMEEQSPNSDILSPFERIFCHYCVSKKCPCCLYEMNHYYNYGLSRRKMTICTDCYSEIYSNGRNVTIEIVTEAFKKICETIIDLGDILE